MGGSLSVEISGLHHHYPVRAGIPRPALGGVDLEVPAASFVAVIGPSGCGKSTLLRLVGGLDDPGQGTVRVDGHDPRTLRGQGLIGLVPQSPALLPWRSVADNVALLDEIGPWGGRGRRLDRGQLDKWLDRVGLGDEANLLPHQLSGGMQQRVALARAFALEPALLLMDEPFSALDELTRHQMQVLLRQLCLDRHPTVVFVTHSIDEAIKLADRVVVLSDTPGRVVADVTIELDGFAADQERPGAGVNGQVFIEDSAQFRSYAAQIRTALIDGEL